MVKVKKLLIYSSLALLLFIAGIATDRSLLNQISVNIPEDKLIVLDPTETIIVKVEKVIDGDTIVLVGGEKVRYMGIDTPELMGKTTGLEREIGKQAYEFNEKAVEGKTVRLEFEPKGKTRDLYGRLLAYVWIGKEMINLELAKRGLAVVQEREYLRFNYSYEEEFLKVQKYAQKNKLGMWEQ